MKFFFSSARFEHRMFIIRKTILYMQPYMLCFPCVYASSLPWVDLLHKRMESILYMAACTI